MESSSTPSSEFESQGYSGSLVMDAASNGKRYSDIFQAEIECWCFGISNFPGQLYPKLVQRVIREISPTFRAAIDNGYIFDVFETAKKIYSACAGVISEKQIVYAILANLPLAFELEEESLFILGQIIDQVEREYGGVIDQMETLWKRERLNKRP